MPAGYSSHHFNMQNANMKPNYFHSGRGKLQSVAVDGQANIPWDVQHPASPHSCLLRVQPQVGKLPLGPSIYGGFVRQIFWDFGRPLSPCTHFGLIHSTKFVYVLNEQRGLLTPPLTPHCGRFIDGPVRKEQDAKLLISRKVGYSRKV